MEELVRDRDPRAVALGVAAGLLKAAGGLLALALSGVLDPAGPVDRTALWWRVLVWDLWFLIWGVLLGVATRQYQASKPSSRA